MGYWVLLGPVQGSVVDAVHQEFMKRCPFVWGLAASPAPPLQHRRAYTGSRNKLPQPASKVVSSVQLFPLRVPQHVPLYWLQAPKEWFFYPNGYDPQHSAKAAAPAVPPAAAPSAGYTVGEEVVPGPDESGRAGPMSKDALRQLHSRGVVCNSTWVWANGMQAPQQLGHVRELRWMLSSGLGLLGPFDAALVALQASLGVVVVVVIAKCIACHASRSPSPHSKAVTYASPKWYIPCRSC